MAAMMKIIAAIFYVVIGAFAATVFLSPRAYPDLAAFIVANGNTSAVVISAALAGLIAIWGIFSQRAISRRAYTLSHLSRVENDKDIIEAKKVVMAIGIDHDRLRKAAVQPFENGELTADAKSLRLVLNDLELTAIGIERGVIDFEFYKLWYRTGTINAWDAMEPFVTALRKVERNSMLFHEVETLVGWLRGKRKPKRGYIVSHWFW